MSNILVIGIIGAIGCDKKFVFDYLKEPENQKKYGYEYNEAIVFSKYLEEFIDDKNSNEKYTHLIDKGNLLRKECGKNDILAIKAITEIAEKIKAKSTTDKAQVFVISSLKHNEEVELLKKVFGLNFFMIGLVSSEENRKAYLEKNNQKCQDSKLFERDLKEEDKNGQQLEKIFKKSDFFIEIVEETSFKKEFTRFFDLLHSHPFHTPEQDEYFMFMAYASSTRSASLSRQVGALIVSENTAKDVVSIGCNEVPKNGGGQYWPNDKNDTREFKHMDEKGQIMDSNKRALNVKVENLTKEVNQKLEDVNIDVKLSTEITSECVKASRFNDSIEDFREEHAECSAISSCARNGIATQGSKLYCTTFPCHLCIKQIVSAGIIEVKFVEPYPKSKINLYEDSVTLNNEDGKVKLKQFLGVGPRRYLDLFSMTLSNGNDLDRSYIKKWEEGKKEPRMPMYNLSNIINNFLAAIKGIYYYSLNYSN